MPYETHILYTETHTHTPLSNDNYIIYRLKTHKKKYKKQYM